VNFESEGHFSRPVSAAMNDPWLHRHIVGGAAGVYIARRSKAQ